jgi:hypothetical protein
MDTGALIIILAITAAIILPFFIMYLFKKRKYMKFENEFIELAQKEGIILSQKEIWNHRYAIGLDNNSKKIIYTNKKKENVESSVIDLTEVSKCNILSVNKTVKNQNGKSALTDRLELVFTFRNPLSPAKNLEFYESSEFMPNEEERAHIEKWLQIVNSNI